MMAEEKVRVFGYARKSPDDEEDTEKSINNQVDLIKSVCQARGWQLEEVFIDKNVSGGDRFRKAFMEMIDAIYKRPEVAIIVTKDQERFCRDSAFFSDSMRGLEIRGKAVFSILKNGFLSYEDLGDMVTSVVSAHYITTQRKKTALLFQQKKEKGLPPIVAPYGYEHKTSGKEHLGWVVKKRAAEVVTQVVSDYLAGINYRETLKNLRIGKSLYYRILRNAGRGVYSGWVVYKVKHRDFDKSVIREEEVRYRGSQEVILPEEQAAQVKAKLAENVNGWRKHVS